jgi:protein MpaA
VTGWLALGAALAALGGASPTAGPDAPGLSSAVERMTQPDKAGHHSSATIGISADGRPIRLLVGGYPKETRVLVFGCIHGTECAGTRVAGSDLLAGCPPPGDVFAVPNLNPDGYALGTRLNGRGVDLNRNFPSEWTASGVRGDPQYSGPRPLSEPESRLAARLIRAVRPDVTIWFHQEAEPMIRAWGPSVPAARRYARLVGLPFHRLPWLNGTAPNWQNHRFPGTSSFVVELAHGPLSHAAVDRHKHAIQELSEPP